MIGSYREEIRVVEMGCELASAYQAFEQATADALAAYLAGGNSSGLLPWLHALLVYPDMPWLGYECVTEHDVRLGEARPLSASTIYPLELALLDYVEQQYRDGLPLLVFTGDDGGGDDQERLKDLIEQRGRENGRRKTPQVVILRQKECSANGPAWLERHMEEGVDVLVCNPAVMNTQELNLTPFKRIAFKRFPASRKALYHAARCLITPAQRGNLQTVFFVYASSMALRLLHQVLALNWSGQREHDDVLSYVAQMVQRVCASGGDGVHQLLRGELPFVSDVWLSGA